jgi:hypothetical protein
MSDTNLGVVGAGSPDKYLDGEQVTVGGTAVFRSRTRARRTTDWLPAGRLTRAVSIRIRVGTSRTTQPTAGIPSK